MATISVTVPDTMVPTLLTVATNYLTSLGIDLTGMTNLQIARRYIAEKLKADYISQTGANQAVTSQNEVTTAINQAKIDAQGIS